MSDHSQTQDTACDEVRRAIDEQLDETRFWEIRNPQSAIRNHLAVCGSCRDYRQDLLAMREGLRSLPLIPLPDDALQSVLSRTVGSDPAGHASRHRIGLAHLATAAAVALGVLVPWFILHRPNASVREAELDRAVVEARYVLDVVTQALQRVERAAVDEVLSGRISPAVNRVSIDWSNFPLPVVRRSGT